MNLNAQLFRTAACAVSLILLSGGCVGYQLGATLPHDVQTIHVPTFKNNTTEPLLEVAATDATISRFQFDGAVQITGENQADALLQVTLRRYELVPLSYDEDQSTRTREYRAKVYANIVLLRRSTGEVILDNPSVEGEATFYMAGDLTSSKKSVEPDLTEDLAKHIVDTVTQTW